MRWTEEKEHSGIWKRKRRSEGERRNQKAPGEREESRKRKVCTPLLISLRKMMGGYDGGGGLSGWRSGEAGAVGGGGALECCRSRQTSGWVNRLMGVRGGEARWGEGWGERHKRCAGGNSSISRPGPYMSRIPPYPSCLHVHRLGRCSLSHEYSCTAF